MSETHPIDLMAQRQLTIREAGQTYMFTLDRITDEMWKRYFAGIINSSEQSGRDIQRQLDTSAARVALVLEALVNVNGYVLPIGVDNITEIDGWKSKVPTRHLQAVGTLLVDAKRVEYEGPIAFGFERVVLESLWNADDSGAYVRHRLIHNFKTPSAEQHKRYAIASSRSVVVGGSRRGKTVWLGTNNVLAELYDELIESVDGYVLPGEINTWMDTYHKVTAALSLFAPIDVEEPEEAN